VPATIDGRPAVLVRRNPDGREFYEPLRDPADPSQGTSPYPHYSTAVGGGPGHLSDLIVHSTPAEGSTISRHNQTYRGQRGGDTPKARNDLYVDTRDGSFYSRRGGGFKALDQVAPVSPRTASNEVPRLDMTFKDAE